MSVPVRTYVLPAIEPFRLDLTVAVLRRFSTNVVDLVAGDGTYLRAHATARGHAVVSVRRARPDAVEVAVRGPAAAHDALLANVTRTLGLMRTTPAFAAGAAEVPWLGALANRMAGVKPPRYATLWEACVNAIVFQQISLAAATAILGRIVVALGESLAHDAVTLRTFPDAATLLRASDARLRSAGLSVGKIATLRRVANAIVDATLDEAVLEAVPSAEAAARLCGIKGIGPWTAAVILLRGLGRLDVFPANDSGVARSLATLTGATVDLPHALARLAPEQGMLYYHLLLARLEARGEVVS